MKTIAKSRALSVKLTPRQYDALRAYTDAIDSTMAGYVRALVTPSIPSQFWDREETPPGQLTIPIGGSE
jgi:hypothetical protein